MKASMHAAREGTAKHNDRSFDYTGDKHIDPNRVKDNIYMSYKNLPFSESEKVYYKDHYSNWLNDQNKKYKMKGNQDKCRSIRNLLSRKNTCPEEMIIQVGDRNEAPSKEVFESCVRDFLKDLQKYSSNYHIINVAIHNDETTPHAHIRSVWDYTDENGNLHISQGKALDALGIPLPDPERPGNSRYNNRKITIQREMRETWYRICEEHGLKIDRVPDKSNDEHFRIREYVMKQQEEQIRENQEKLVAQASLIEKQTQDLQMLLQEIRRAEEHLVEKEGRKRTRKFLQSQEISSVLEDIKNEMERREQENLH